MTGNHVFGAESLLFGSIPLRPLRLRGGMNSFNRRGAEDAEQDMNPNNLNELTEAIIGAAIEVHRLTGPALLESSYRQCLCRELSLRNIPFLYEQQLPLN